MGWLAPKGGFLVGADYDVWMRISEMDMSLGVMEGGGGVEEFLCIALCMRPCRKVDLHALRILAGLT